MAETTTTQIVREAPKVEAYKTGIYSDALDYVRRLQESGIAPPTQAVAGMTADQIAAGDIIRTGIGGYEPFLQGALQSTQAGQDVITGGALPGIQAALLAQQGGLGTLRDAQTLAADTRAEPYSFRDQAIQGLSRAASDITGAAAGVPLQVQAAQRGLSAADVAAQRAASDTATRLGLGAEQGRQLAADVGIGALGTAGALGGQLGAATRGGLQTAAQGQRGLLQSRQDIGGIRGGLTDAGAQFDPSGIAAFMDPYTQQVVEAARQESLRTGELQKQQARAQQVAAGAFGGSRGAVQAAEIDRAINDQIARQTSGLLSQGYGQALQASQQAFEAGKGRELQAAGLGGQLAQSEAGLSAQGAQLGHVCSTAGGCECTGTSPSGTGGSTATRFGWLAGRSNGSASCATGRSAWYIRCRNSTTWRFTRRSTRHARSTVIGFDGGTESRSGTCRRSIRLAVWSTRPSRRVTTRGSCRATATSGTGHWRISRSSRSVRRTSGFYGSNPSKSGTTRRNSNARQTCLS
jgi:hypothetical protein